MSPRKEPRSTDGLTTDDMVRDIYVRVIGDGTEANPGLTVEMDRLKRDVGTAKKLGAGALGTAFTLGAGYLWAKLTGAKP